MDRPNPSRGLPPARILPRIALALMLAIACGDGLPRLEADPPASQDRSPLKPSASSSSEHRILFIGNSLTYWNDGIDAHLQRLCASAGVPVPLETGRSVKGGATLKVHWERPEPRAMIAQGRWTDVVLQEDLPEINLSYFREHARRFVEEIRKAGARPILLMTWAYVRLDWIDNDRIAEAHRTLGRELGVDIAPVAVAWQRVLRERPDLDLFAPDREHPSLRGTYLETCVVYATVMRSSPVPLRHVPAGLPEQEALYLRQVAWETVREWKP